MLKILVYIIFSIFLSISGNAQNTGDLYIEVQDLRNFEGNLSIVLFNQEDGFPEDASKALNWKTIDLNREKPAFIFSDLPAGTYAFSILHDEDENGKMEKNFLGIPKEGFGFSNNYRPRVKNPSFEDAAFRLKPGENNLVIEMVYYL